MYCREREISIWEGVWKRAGERVLPRKGGRLTRESVRMKDHSQCSAHPSRVK